MISAPYAPHMKLHHGLMSAGKVLLILAGVFVVIRLVHARKEHKEEQRNEQQERFNMDRMRRAREEAQKKLEELGKTIMKIAALQANTDSRVCHGMMGWMRKD